MVKRRGYEPDNTHRQPGDTTIIVPERGLPVDRPLFLTSIAATTVEPSFTHTIWLKAKDYAAHCLVTPALVAGGKTNYLHGFENPLTHDPLKTITVPRDYDGYEMPGVNYGDQLPDHWEETEFQVTNPASLRNIRPFIEVSDGPGHRSLIDPDDEPTGRDIDGDYFCNFEEYRGLMVAEDSTDTSLGHKHVRLDPLRKSVMVHFRNNLENEILEAMPGYLYKLPGIELYLTDSMRWGPVATWDDRFLAELQRDLLEWRDVNFNKTGAGRWYMGYGLPTSSPIPDSSKANAVTFWQWDEGRDGSIANDSRAVGLTVAVQPPVFIDWPSHSSAAVPRRVKRCLVALQRLDALMAVRPHYIDHPEHIPGDRKMVVKKIIAHEFGHAVGMVHFVEDNTTTWTIMNSLLPLPLEGLRFYTGDSLFSPISLQQYSLKGAHP